MAEYEGRHRERETGFYPIIGRIGMMRIAEHLTKKMREEDKKLEAAERADWDIWKPEDVEHIITGPDSGEHIVERYEGVA